MIISYPNGIQAKGEIRSQYLHVIDIAPTILDILGTDKPDHIKGVAQKPYHGVSFATTFDHADAPDVRHIQYFEQTGNRGLWKDGWKAITNHIHEDDYVNETWELYHVAEDFSEAKNVADQYPEKLQELIALWYVQAGKYGVLPLGDGPYLTQKPEKSLNVVKENKFYVEPQKFVYKGVLHPLDITTKTIFNRRNHKIIVEIDHKADHEGILYSAGNRFGGYVLYIQENRLKYAYNYHREEVFQVTSEEPLPEGKITVQVQFKLTETGTAVAKLFVNGKSQGETEITGFIFMMETHAYLKDGGTSSIIEDYKLPFEYPSPLLKVELDAAGFWTDKNELEEQFFRID